MFLALKLLIGLVKTIQGVYKSNIAILLSLDISSAFNTIIYNKLYKIIVSKGFLE